MRGWNGGYLKNLMVLIRDVDEAYEEFKKTYEETYGFEWDVIKNREHDGSQNQQPKEVWRPQINSGEGDGSGHA
jgi:hypothetical protein